MKAEMRYETGRRYYLRLSEADFQGRPLPEVLINVFRRKGYIECQTLDLVKLNQRIQDSHQEVVLMSDKTITELLEAVRAEIPALYRVCESIAMLDMLSAFAKLVTVHEYVRPEMTASLAIKAGRHPVYEKVVFLNCFTFQKVNRLFVARHTQRISFQMTYMRQSRHDFKSSLVAI
jgi:DNA mismatch repair protein MSH4